MPPLHVLAPYWGSQGSGPASGLHLSSRRCPPHTFVGAPMCPSPQMNILLTPASVPLLEPEMHVESELRPKQEMPHAGPESFRSHLPEVGAIAVEACPSSQSESPSPCMDPPGLSPTPLHEASVRATPRKLYTCEQCGLSFDWKSVFVIHHRTHMGGSGIERPPQVAWEPAIRRPPGLRGYTRMNG